MLHVVILITDSSNVITAIWMEIHHSCLLFFPAPLSHAVPFAILPLQEDFYC